MRTQLLYITEAEHCAEVNEQSSAIRHVNMHCNLVMQMFSANVASFVICHKNSTGC